MASRQSSEKFHRLIWPQLAGVLRLARVLCGNAAEAEDLAQETMLRAYRAIDRFADGSDARAWLLTILRNVWIDKVRAAATRPAHVSLDAAQVSVADESDDVSREQASQLAWEDPDTVLNAFADQQVIEALKSLPEEIRFTLLLVDVEQLDQVDAASILGVPVGTIKSRAHRGRTMLRQRLLPLAREMRLIRK